MEDFAGLKLRVIPNPVFLETFKALKANPVPMNFGELYTALENKTVDGQENPYTVILSNKFYEVQKYVSATNHAFTQNILLVSKKFWDKLSPEEQKLMREAVAETREYQREQTRIQAEKALTELKAKGMTFNAMPRTANMRACSRRPRRSRSGSLPISPKARSNCSTPSWSASARRTSALSAAASLPAPIRVGPR